MNTLQNIKSILVIKDSTAHALYLAQFTEYLSTNYLVVNEDSFHELTIEKTRDEKVFLIENKLFKRTDDTNAFSLYSEKPAHVSISMHYICYSKGFIITSDQVVDFNNEIINLPLPTDYVYAKQLTCTDENGKDFIFDDEVKFSYSCGYYNSEECVVINYTLYNREYTVTLHDGRIVHEDDAVYCDEIEEFYHIDDCVRLENGEWLPEDMTIRTHDGCYYSQNDENIDMCSACEEYFHCEDFTYCEHEDAIYCDNCYSEVARLHNRLSYSANVLDYHDFGDPQSIIAGRHVYVGFELECLACEHDAGYLSDILYDMKYGNNGFDYCIGTEDGSLDSRYGVEFIFKPDSIKNHAHNIDHFIENCSEYLHERAGSDYGLHVHVSNNFLSEFDKIKIQNILSLHDKMLRKVGGRADTMYQRKKSILKKSDMKKGDSSRYQAVNITPSDTIEFRFPVSKVDKNHILLNLQLAYSIVIYAKYHCNYVTIGDFNLYLTWLRSNKEFKLLSDFF